MKTSADMAREMLKDVGYSQRQVTVRQDGGSVRVTIRDASVSLYKVHAVLSSIERIRRCESTGEILAGGNTYLDVRYEKKILEPYIAAAKLCIDSVPPGQTVRIGFHAVHQSSTSPWDVTVRTTTLLDNGREVMAHGLTHGLEIVVIDNLSRGAYASCGSSLWSTAK